MDMQFAGLENAQLGNRELFCRVSSFGAILNRVLGEHAWEKLESAIATRFTASISGDRPLSFVGTMQWVYCSPVGFVIAKIIKRLSILPDICARDAAFTFTIGMKNNQICKQRTYDLGNSERFIFTSSFSNAPRLHEEFGGGIGMYLGLYVKRKALLFRDQGYFLRLKKWRLYLPRWLTVGHFDLLHRNIDDQRFQIIIRVVHPLLGTLFYQRGEFKIMQA